MKRKIVKALAICWTFVLILSVCGCNGGGTSNSGGKNHTDTPYNELAEYTGGKHIFNVKETSSYLLKDGITHYAILISENAKVNERTAATEFYTLFKEATGVTLDIVSDQDVSWSETAEYISFGENAFADASGVTTTEEVKGNGYIIKTAGKSIIVKGGQSIGTLFGAYELLNQLFGYMCYAVDCYYIDRGVKDVRFCEYDILDNPDIDQRLANYGVIYNSPELAHKLRFQLQYAEVYLNPTRAFHNTLEYLPKDQFIGEHSKWYSTGGDQLCYTAHGDETEFDAMVDAMADALKPYIEAEPEKRIITVTQEDIYSWCECETCSALRAYYGTDAASNIIFVNAVAEKIEQWLKESYPGRDLTIATFAYHRSENPPAVKDADGKWHPIDQKVVARDNVTILYAPLVLMEFNHSVEDEENSTIKDILEGWEACTSHIAVWNYQTHFISYFMPYDTFAVCREQYKRYIDLGASWIFDQGQQNNGNSTGFSMLKIYLNSQWGWDVNRDYTTLVDNFFENYFGKKDGAMRTFYEEMRAWLNYLDVEGILGGRCTDTGDSSEYWPQQLVNQWLGYIDDAYSEIEPLKITDPDTYKLLERHIRLESMMPRYMAIRYYIGSYSSSEQQKMKSEFAADCGDLGITKVREMGDISVLIGDW
ncbi:MAG: DUF4838 domain-containing protein [Candidatus Gallimonas sp.]